MTADLIADKVAEIDFGRPAYRKRGRTAARPYVPLIVHRTGGIRDDGYEEQLRGKAFVTSDEAHAYAAAVIDYRREVLARHLADPKNRLLREHYGLPRDL